MGLESPALEVMSNIIGLFPKPGAACYCRNETRISPMFSLWSMKGGGLECYVTIHNPAVKCQVGQNIFLPDL